MVVWLSAAIMAPSCCCAGGRWLAFGAEPFWTRVAPDHLRAGMTGGVGGSVVLTSQPHDRVAVVLAAGGDGDPGAESQGGFAVAHGLLAVGAVGVGVAAGSAWRRHAPTPWTRSAGQMAGGGHGPHPLSFAGSPTACSDDGAWVRSGLVG